jgi:hypothetical protein
VSDLSCPTFLRRVRSNYIENNAYDTFIFAVTKPSVWLLKVSMALMISDLAARYLIRIPI